MSNSLERIERLTEKFRIETVRDQDDTINIRYGVYGDKKADRYLIFLNGRTEWVEKYAYLADDLQLPSNVGFIAVDHRGQGGSGGARSYVSTYDNYATDLKAVVAKATDGKPYGIIAHSMGGLIGLYATMTGQIAPVCMVLGSPLLGMPNVPVPRPIAKPLSRILNTIGLGNVSSGGGNFSKTAFEYNKLTHDIDLYRRMQDSPYKLPGATFGWVDATFRAMDTVFDEQLLKEYKVPTIILAGSEEQVVDPDATRRWVGLNSDRRDIEVRYHMIAGARHELLSEMPVYYEQAVHYIKAYLAKYFWKK